MSMEKAVHDVVVVPFGPRIERGGKVLTSGGRQCWDHLFVEKLPIGWKEGILLP